MKLSQLIAEIWNRANRVFAPITGAKILRFLLFSNDGFALKEVETDTVHVPHPAKWAPDTGQDENVNARWLGGKWASGTASSGTVSTSDDIMAAQWNALIDDLKTHNHDGTHGKQLTLNSVDDYSLTYEVFQGGSASYFIQPTTSYLSGSAALFSSDTSLAFMPSPTAHLSYPGTAFFSFSPPAYITSGSLVFHFFYGVELNASGSISATFKIFDNGSETWTKNISFNASTLTSKAAEVGGTVSYQHNHSYQLLAQRNSDSSSYDLLIHGVLAKFFVRP